MKLKKHVLKAFAGAILLGSLFTGGVNAYASEPPKQTAEEDDEVKVVNFGLGYCGVTFTIPGTEKECFITGLKPEAVDDIRERVIESYVDGQDFDIDQIDIIDCEKDMGTTGNDSMLCWAGAASNLLHYTGWGRVAGFKNEDEIFREFAKHFPDEGSHTYNGYEWFFKGGAKDSNDVSGGYLREYDYRDLCSSKYVPNMWEDSLKDIVSGLKSGYGVNIDVDWLSNGTVEEAHAVTLWGVIVDNSYGDSEKEHYDSFIISNSDNNRPYIESADKTALLNTLDVRRLEPFYQQIDYTLYDTFMLMNNGLFKSYSLIKPYSEDVEKETDERATLNPLETADFIINRIGVANTDEFNGEVSRVFAGDVYIIPEIENIGDVDFAGRTRVDISLSDSKGQVIKEWSENWDYDIEARLLNNKNGVGISDLAAGDYSVSVTINPDKAVTEAMFINNSREISFTVVENDEKISGMKMTAELSSESRDLEIRVKPFYEGLEGSKLVTGCESIKLEVLDASYEGVFGIYDQSYYTFDEGYDPLVDIHSLPGSFTLRGGMDKVVFRLVIKKDDIIVYIKSPVYVVDKARVDVSQTENNSEVITEIAPDAGKLNPGEQFAFRIKNENTGESDKITGTYRICTVQSLNPDVEHELLSPVAFELEPGASTDEIIFDSWEPDIVFSESCTVAAEVKYIFRGEEYSTSTVLGTLPIREQGSAVVTAFFDRVNAYDGWTSFREAVAYAGEHPGETVTVKQDLGELFIDKPIHISGKVKISGLSKNLDGDPCPLRIRGNENNQLFIIDKGAELDIDHVYMSAFGSDTYGGAIRNDGGRLVMTDCSFSGCKSISRGGSVYISDGSAVIKNTSFITGSSGFGGAVCARGNSDVEILNSGFYYVKYGDGVIYNDVGRMNIINSDVAFCSHDDTTKISGAIYGGSKTNVINSIVINKIGTDVTPRVNVYASAIGNPMHGAKLDSLTVSDLRIEDVFSTDMGGLELEIGTDGRPQSYALTRDKASEGYLTSVSGGVIYVSKDGKTKTSTGVRTSFTNEELAADITGAVRPPFFGCYVGSKKNVEDLKMEPIPAQLYTGEEIWPEIKIYDGDKLLKKGVDYRVAEDFNIEPGMATGEIYARGNYVGIKRFTFEIVRADLSYRAYVQKKGWMAYKKDGALAGTTDNLRMETIQLKLGKNTNVKGGIRYRAYVQKLGWTFWADTAIAASYAGTKGRSLRIEAVQIKPYGDLASLYDVYYRVYTDKYNWLGWTKNGGSAGTSGLAYKLRGFEVKLVEKGAAAPGKTTKPYATNKNP